MSDDTVTKLEFLLKEGAEIIKEQAIEIERLRTLTSELVQIMMPLSLLMTSEEQQKVIKVVRGE